MAEFIRHRGVPRDCQIISTGCWHVGSRCFDEDAARHVTERLRKEETTFGLFNGDAAEAKPLGSKHFAPSTLVDDEITIGQQYDKFRDLIKPAKKKWLAFGRGNHDMYLSENDDSYYQRLKELGVENRYGGYQTWVHISKDLRIHMYHGKKSIPQGAKDPIQRDGNQRAWLKRILEPLAGDCHVQLLGHVHTLLIQPPIPETTLLTGGENVRRETFILPPMQFKDDKGRTCYYVDPRSRWYGINGTLRGSGGFGFVDYSEIAGYAPPEVGYLELTIRDGKCVNMEKIVL